MSDSKAAVDLEAKLNSVFTPLKDGVYTLTGETLTPEDLSFLGAHFDIQVTIGKDAERRIKEGRAVISNVLKRGEVVYGINTGFGAFANVVIEDDQLAQLQRNLIRSHASGLGDALSPCATRMLLILRLNVLCKGHSGIRMVNVQRALGFLNSNVLPRVPEKGTVGASGDLAPLAHLALGLMGEGDLRDPKTGKFESAKGVIKRYNLVPVELHAKEGLALINGTQMITSIGCEAVVRARRLAVTADIISALTLDVLKGTSTAFHPRIHAARPHSGQIAVAHRLRQLLVQSGVSQLTLSHANCGRVQDSYTLRCIPQVHGVVHDTINFVENVLTTECNSATDNPMIFPDVIRRPSHIDHVEVHYSQAQREIRYLEVHMQEMTSDVLRRNGSCEALHSLGRDNGNRSSSSNSLCPANDTHTHLHELHLHRSSQLAGSSVRQLNMVSAESPLINPAPGLDSVLVPLSKMPPLQLDSAASTEKAQKTLKTGESHCLFQNRSSASSTSESSDTEQSSLAPTESKSSQSGGDTVKGVIMSGGNFHGEYPAKMLDFLAIGVHEIGSISERRIERLVNSSLSGLPAFLVRDGGLNSGFMISHCAAAALVSENKVLCHPASVDSISTSAAQEDHVSMGGWAARKALKVVEHCEYILAVELLCAAQALDLQRPLKTTKPLEALHALLRKQVKALDKDRYLAPDLKLAQQLIRDGSILATVSEVVGSKFT